MIVCGDDGLAHRLAAELHDVYRERVTLVAPSPRTPGGLGTAAAARSRASAIIGRVTAVVGRPAGPIGEEDSSGGFVLPVRQVTAGEPAEQVLLDAGVERATALALLYEDDETNIRAALVARRLNPRLRLVLRLYNRKLGKHMTQLLDQAAAVASPGLDLDELDASTTVLSDADTAAPALAATAITGTSKVVQADGLLLRAVERLPGHRGDPGLCTLALLSPSANDPAAPHPADGAPGTYDPQLLPDDEAVAAARGRGTVVLETVTGDGPPLPARLTSGRVPLRELFSRRLRVALAGAAAAVVGLGLATWATTEDNPLHAFYLTLLDLFAINDPAVDQPTARQVLQLLGGLVGLSLLPILIAGALEAFGAFRTASALRRPPRGLSHHVVLLGLGKVGTRVLARLRGLGIPVVCVENDPDARGIALARRLRVPVVLGDVTQDGVLEAAKVGRAEALLALTSSDTTNLEAALAARAVRADLRVALRLYDDDFATAVYRTLRAAHPGALTRSRSVTSLAAPAFAGAMMGRQILGAIPVERKMLLVAALDVAGHPRFEGRTVAQAFQPGSWRVLALDTTDPAVRRRDLRATRRAGEQPRLLWDLEPGYVLGPEDRVVVAATRRGLAELLGRSPGAA
ncbi:NAD-binding protein [Streptomyces sp. NPDC001941]|uniref:NAD-binding protein n=1 Tax=Streptomyces sp. NPDC001941 TaxID=3154659 RepID=UPI003330EBC0